MGADTGGSQAGRMHSIPRGSHGLRYAPSSQTAVEPQHAAAVVALGILALVGEFYRSRSEVVLPGRLLPYVGRMALSCYLLQNILGVLAQYTVLRLPVFSWLWLRRFSRE